MNARTAAVVVALAALLALAGCANAPTDDPTLAGADGPADPSSDRLGWEYGYWYNESLPITTDDGLNETEQDAVVHRAMARVEHLRGIEFEKDVPVTVITRETYREQTGASGSGGEQSLASRVFSDVRYEALFLVGEGGSGQEQSSENQAASVVGYYSPSADRIVVISETKTPILDETTLAHELVHALQFRNFEMGFGGSTLEARSANLGLVEGDAQLVSQWYGARCGDEWSCVKPAPAPSNGNGSGGPSAGFHYGIYFTQYFPYSDGPGFVHHFYERGGWSAVNDLYERPPASAEQVAVPAKYRDDAPTPVELDDRSNEQWDRVRPEGRTPYGEFGVAGLTGMFAYPSYEETMDDTAPAKTVIGRAFLTLNANGSAVGSDPINYTTTPVEGWDGDRLHVYWNGETAGYVWKLVWDSPEDAREFAATYRDLLRYWGANRVGDGLYRIPADASNFADAFSVSVQGDTVVVVNAPTVDALSGVRAGTSTS